VDWVALGCYRRGKPSETSHIPLEKDVCGYRIVIYMDVGGYTGKVGKWIKEVDRGQDRIFMGRIGIGGGTRRGELSNFQDFNEKMTGNG
jgi:hypothetical protein